MTMKFGDEDDLDRRIKEYGQGVSMLTRKMKELEVRQGYIGRRMEGYINNSGVRSFTPLSPKETRRKLVVEDKRNHELLKSMKSRRDMFRNIIDQLETQIVTTELDKIWGERIYGIRPDRGAVREDRT